MERKCQLVLTLTVKTQSDVIGAFAGVSKNTFKKGIGPFVRKQAVQDLSGENPLRNAFGHLPMASNPARDAHGIAATQTASTQAGPALASRPVVTQTSGASAPTSPAMTQPSRPAKPVVTRSSGAAGTTRKPEIERDDGPAIYEE